MLNWLSAIAPSAGDLFRWVTMGTLALCGLGAGIYVPIPPIRSALMSLFFGLALAIGFYDAGYRMGRATDQAAALSAQIEASKAAKAERERQSRAAINLAAVDSKRIADAEKRAEEMQSVIDELLAKPPKVIHEPAQTSCNVDDVFARRVRRIDAAGRH